MSGFPCRGESEHDLFDTGRFVHVISMALRGWRAPESEPRIIVVAVHRDGALTQGRHVLRGDERRGQRAHAADCTILNDNEMSISKMWARCRNISSHLRAGASCTAAKSASATKADRAFTTLIGKPLARAIENAKNMVKSVTTGGEMFEALGFRYLGVRRPQHRRDDPCV